MTKCYFCGKELPQGKNYCVHCDHETNTVDPFVKTINYRKRSKVWYLLPIFFQALGGALMFIALRKENDEMAKKGLILGIVLQIIGIVIFVGLFSIGMRSFI